MGVVGTAYFGKTDHVPGLFYVASQFEHWNGVPIIPRGTFVVLCKERRTGNLEAVLIERSWKSLLFLLLRMLLVVAIGVLIYLTFKEGMSSNSPPLPYLAWLLTLGLVLLMTFVPWIHRAKPLRALQLAPLVGVSYEEVAERFVSKQEVPDFLASHQEDLANLSGKPI